MRPLAPVALSLAVLALAPLTAQEPDAWDFVPGERTIFFDDYTDMPRGAAPPHWKVRGAALRLVDGRLTAKAGEESTLWPNVEKWPANFTLEMDVHLTPFDDDGVPPRALVWTFLTGDAWVVNLSLEWNTAATDCTVFLEIADPGENQRQRCRVKTDGPNRFALWSQDGRLRVYVNGERIVDINQVKLAFDQASLRITPSPVPVALGPVRIAESAPDFSRTLLASGRYVSHGILFDVDSDRIRPESQPVLQAVADALAAQGGLKLRIEGHTDASGDPAANLDLSRRRAASVKAALVALGVTAERLTTEGLGDTRPAAPNDTPKGRTENRRVEFVKL